MFWYPHALKNTKMLWWKILQIKKVPFLGFQMCGTPLKVFACVPETLGGYPLRRYHTTMGPGETFWETPGPIQGLRTGFPIGRPILASKIGLFKVIFGSFWAILCHIWSFLAEFGPNSVEYHPIQPILAKNRSKRHFLDYFWPFWKMTFFWNFYLQNDHL